MAPVVCNNATPEARQQNDVEGLAKSLRRVCVPMKRSLGVETALRSFCRLGWPFRGPYVTRFWTFFTEPLQYVTTLVSPLSQTEFFRDVLL